jgi:hypothetical protein
MDSHGELYGTTFAGGGSGCGGNGCGTVFALKPSKRSPSGFAESVLHSFTGGSDGAQPLAGLILVNRILYGTTPFGGGANNGGTVFSIKP